MRKPIDRRFFISSVATLTLSAAAGGALAQAAPAWPTKPISMIVPFPAGGTTDVLARALGLELSKAVGQPVRG